jgi:hypothetical protein
VVSTKLLDTNACGRGSMMEYNNAVQARYRRAIAI